MTSVRPSPPRLHLRRVVLLAVALIALVAASVARAESGPSFAEANRAFAEGRYADAVTSFEALTQSRGWSAPLLYNLGNAHARAGSVGHAVLSYERARLLAPRDAAIAANLALVRQGAGLPTPARAWPQRLARVVDAGSWTALAAAGLGLAAFGFVAARRRRSRPLACAASFAALLGATSVAAVVTLDRTLDDAVVVAQKSASLRLSPFDGAAVEATVGEGDEVAIVQRHGDFVRVRDGSGHAGWLESSAVQLIVPRRS